MSREAVIVAGKRTAVGKAKRGTTRNARSDDMAAAVIRTLMAETDLDPASVDDVIIGCAMPEGAQGLNFARTIAMLSGLPVDVPGMTVNRFCSSGLQTIAMAAERSKVRLYERAEPADGKWGYPAEVLKKLGADAAQLQVRVVKAE